MSMHVERLARARRALEGVALGDAFGERFFGDHAEILPRLEARQIDDAPLWRWTDDTAMALALFEALEAERFPDPAVLSMRFLERYVREPWRGYGGGIHRLMHNLTRGQGWEEAARGQFDGSGSFGNGAAMRVAPLGGYFADRLDLCVEQARRSSLPTHTHPEGVAGAVAIAVVAASAWRTRKVSVEVAAEQIWREVLGWTPDSEVREGLVKARRLGPEASFALARDRLGNGSSISAQDTVPFCVWSACKHLRDFEGALWGTVSALGDRDTTCAIVGGIVALSAPEAPLPAAWLERQEPLAGVPLSDEAPVR